jgi:hypothetical protein
MGEAVEDEARSRFNLSSLQFELKVCTPIEISIIWIEEVCPTGEKDKRKEQV